MLKKVLFIITAIMCMSLCSCGEHTKKSSCKSDSEPNTYSEKDSKTDIVATLKYDNGETHNLIIGDETHEICGFTDDLDTINKILSEYFPGIQSQNKHYLESDTCDCVLVLQECSVGPYLKDLEEEPVYNLGKCYMLIFVVDQTSGCFNIPLSILPLEGYVSNALMLWYYENPTTHQLENQWMGISQYDSFPASNILLSEEDIISLGLRERPKHIKID